MEALNVGILQLKLPKQSFRSGMKKGENEESGIKHGLKRLKNAIYIPVSGFGSDPLDKNPDPI